MNFSTTSTRIAAAALVSLCLGAAPLTAAADPAAHNAARADLRRGELFPIVAVANGWFRAVRREIARASYQARKYAEQRDRALARAQQRLLDGHPRQARRAFERAIRAEQERQAYARKQSHLRERARTRRHDHATWRDRSRREDADGRRDRRRDRDGRREHRH